ncbi:MAG: PhzF family phenazine biosynthesis protein [Longimicrobiales bacterium]
MQRFIQVDAFTDEPFRGNPAAVLVLDQAVSGAWMQAVAREMNLSETAFLRRRDNGWQLRWFTPTVEVDLCGHATLASAHALWEEGHAAAEAELRFETRSGPLAARRTGDWIELDFPAEPATACEAPAGLAEALGARPVSVARNRFDLLVLLDSETELNELAPDFRALRAVANRGVIVTSRTERGEADFVSRFFAPAVGIDEDPVTGSVHCCLAPFWAERLGRDELTGYQASARGGTVRVAVRGARVLLFGQAITVLRGELSRAALPAEAASSIEA